MITYLYGLILARNAHLVPAHITGIAGRPVRAVACEALEAIVSTLDRAPARSDIDSVRAHDHALQAVVHHGATAAATRFGQSFASDDDLRRDVIDRSARISRVLEEYDGFVEMRLVLAQQFERAAVASSESWGPGRTYLEQRRAALESGGGAEGGGAALRPALGPVIRAERVEELPKGRGVVFAHLVRRRDESAYRAGVAALPSLAEARIVGPLALYSFAEPVE